MKSNSRCSDSGINKLWRVGGEEKGNEDGGFQNHKQYLNIRIDSEFCNVFVIVLYFTMGAYRILRDTFIHVLF